MNQLILQIKKILYVINTVRFLLWIHFSNFILITASLLIMKQKYNQKTRCGQSISKRTVLTDERQG